jgi:hypothetical protein
VRERPAQRALLDRADGRVINASRNPDRVQLLANGRIERSFASDCLEVLERRHRNELRIDCHRAECGVWRPLVRRHLIYRQQLQDALASSGEPPGERFNIADFTDAPAACRGNGKERNQYPGATT